MRRAGIAAVLSGAVAGIFTDVERGVCEIQRKAARRKGREQGVIGMCNVRELRGARLLLFDGRVVGVRSARLIARWE